MTFRIRPYQPDDFEPVTHLWRVAREVSLPDFQAAKGHPFEKDQWYFREHILPNNTVWVIDRDRYPVAFLAIDGDMINHLYVHPDYQRQGIGVLLLAFARQLSPSGLQLFTLQINAIARAFYEKNGFEAAKFGISPPPESEPDILYHWKPQVE